MRDMLPSVDRKCSTASKEKKHRKTKEKKNKHKLKPYNKSSRIASHKNLVQYSDVSSEELSSPEAGEIHSDFDDKHGALRFKPNKIITENLRITKVTSPRNLLPSCSPLSNHWELDSSPEDSSMSTNISNNCVDMTSELLHLKYKKNKKSSKKPKSPGSKKKKKKKDVKHKSDTILSDCDNSFKFSSVGLSRRNGDLNEPVKKSHTPPLEKSTHIKVSKVQVTHIEDDTHKHLRKEDKR